MTYTTQTRALIINPTARTFTTTQRSARYSAIQTTDAQLLCLVLLALRSGYKQV